MKKTAILIATAVFVSATPAFGQQTKVLTAEKHNEYGLVYSLPKTALRVTVKARKLERKAGPYYQYAKKYLGTDRVITEDASAWSITDVMLEPYGVSDDTEQYLMQLKPGSPTTMGVSDNGMILSINTAPKRSRLREMAQPATACKAAVGNEYLQYVDEDFIGSQAKAKQAEMLSASLMEVRDSYLSLTRGTADNMPTDGKQLELMLGSLKAQEKALTEAFTGVSHTEEAVRTYTFVPEKDGKEILFRLSDFGGFTTKDDYSGDPVYLTVKVTRRGELPKDADGVEKKFPKDGVVYGIPGTANIKISYKGETLADEDFEMAQFGTTFGLNPALFTSKKDPSYAIFSDVTGGLLEIGTVRNLDNGQQVETGEEPAEATE